MIPDIEPYNNYGGNNSNTRFDFDFFIEDTSQLSVVHINSDGIGTTLIQDVDYSIHEFLVNEQAVVENYDNGGYIIFPLETSSYEILKEGEKISLQLTLPIVQEAEYKNSSLLNLFNLEFSLDYLTRICQILKRQMERCLKLQEGVDINNDEAIQNINAVAKNADNINLVANNLEDIKSADENAQIAKESVESVSGIVEEVKQYSLNAKTSEENTLQYKDLTKSYCDDANSSKVIAISSAQLAQEKANEIYYNAEQIQTNTNDISEIKEKIESGEIGSSGAGMPIGLIYPLVCTKDYIPDGSLPTDGAEYSKSQFNSVWGDYLTGETPLLNICTYTEYEQDLLTYGQCSKFAVDVENEKFRVPLIKDGAVIQQALTNDELGKAYNAGLPNITGTIFSSRLRSKTNEQKTGAFSNSGSITKANTANNDGADVNAYSIDFDASLSNPIYGNSETVQMNAVALRHFVVVANGQVNESMMDWSAWASSLQGKANVDGSNFNQSVKNFDGQWVQSFYTITSTGGTLSGVQYDLSEYLPKDDYAYDVKFNFGGYDDDSSYYYYIQTDIFDSGHTDTGNSDYKQLQGALNSRHNRIIFDLPVGTGRFIKLYGSGADVVELRALGYRRIGINK